MGLKTYILKKMIYEANILNQSLYISKLWTIKCLGKSETVEEKNNDLRQNDQTLHFGEENSTHSESLVCRSYKQLNKRRLPDQMYKLIC